MELNILFEPGKIGNMTLKNRIMMTPLHMGFTMKQEIAFLEARAKGGAASVTAVLGISSSACSSNMCYIDDAIKGDLQDFAKRMRRYDSRSIVQLFHCGRNCKEGLLADPDASIVAPSSVPSPIYRSTPKVLTEEEIEKIIQEFAAAAVICKDAGVDAVEISCSAGYLLNQFLSPHTNLREDKYGGNMENRMSFPKEVIKAVRTAVGKQYPVMLRLSGDSMVEGGYDLGDMKIFSQEVQADIDGFSVTGGWHESKVPQINATVEPGSFAYLAEEISSVVNVPVVACNRIDTGEVAAEILERGNCAFVGCARAFVVEPEFANKIQAGLPYEKCIACNGCLKPILKNEQGLCLKNLEVGHEWE